MALLSRPAKAEGLTGLHFVEARLNEGSDARPQLAARLDEADTLRFANWTRRHVHEIIEIVIDGRVVSRPRLLTPMIGGVIIVDGLTTAQIDSLIPRLLSGRSSLTLRDADRV